MGWAGTPALEVALSCVRELVAMGPLACSQVLTGTAGCPLQVLGAGVHGRLAVAQPIEVVANQFVLLASAGAFVAGIGDVAVSVLVLLFHVLAELPVLPLLHELRLYLQP